MPEKQTAVDNERSGGEKPIQILRRRRGNVPPELLERNRRQTAVRRRITEALKDGPQTVPQLADRTELQAHEVFWHLMGMKKYGKVAEGEERDGYFDYKLVQKTSKPEALP